MMWFVKSKRAQSETDYETWIEGEVAPTLNAFDLGDTRAVVIIMRQREGKAGGGKGPMLHDKRSFTIATINDQVLFIDGTRVDDVRVYEDKVMNTVIQRWGTGGGNVPAIQANEMEIRRLTPIECERLQGFPDNWTADQADSHRYKQMGNAVAVPVVSWIINRMVNTAK